VTPRPPDRVRRGAASPWSFSLLYIGWAYVWWLPVLRSDSSVWSGWNLVLFLTGGASPLLAAVVLASATGGRPAVTDLFRRLVAVRSITWRWWVVLLGFWLAFDVTMGAAALLLGVTDRPFTPDAALLTDPVALAFPFLLAFVLPAAEEIGLRGWHLDRLIDRFGTTTAALVNGATWAVWHAPFVLLPGYYADTTFDPQLSWWLPMIVLDTVLIVWVYLGTDRSILAALLFHGMMNLTGELLGISPEMYPFVLVGHALAAGAVVVRWRRTLPARPTGSLDQRTRPGSGPRGLSSGVPRPRTRA
jgi:uncharacterized protein